MKLKKRRICCGTGTIKPIKKKRAFAGANSGRLDLQRVLKEKMAREIKDENK
jgi:hypothetical protein